MSTSWSSIDQTAVFPSGNQGGGITAKLRTWEETLERSAVPCSTLQKEISKTGTYYISRAKGEKGIYSFRQPLPTPTKATIKQGKPEPEDYRRHPSEVGRFEEASTLSRED